MKENMLLWKYPYNAYQDIVNLNKEISSDVLGMPNEDIIKNFQMYGILSEKDVLVLSKKYKENKTAMGIAIECNMSLDGVLATIENCNQRMADTYIEAKSVDFIRINRDTKIKNLWLSEETKKDLENNGFFTLGDLKDSFKSWYAVVNTFHGLSDSTKLLHILKKIPYGKLGIFYKIREVDNKVELLIVREGKESIVQVLDKEEYKSSVLGHIVVCLPLNSKENTEDSKEVVGKVAKSEENSDVTDESPEKKTVNKKHRKAVKRIVESLEDNLDEYLSKGCVRSLKVCEEKGIRTVNDVISLKRSDILAIEGLGDNFIPRLDAFLKENNIWYKEEDVENKSSTASSVEQKQEKVLNQECKDTKNHEKKEEERVAKKLVEDAPEENPEKAQKGTLGNEKEILEGIIEGKVFDCDDVVAKRVFDLYSMKLYSENSDVGLGAFRKVLNTAIFTGSIEVIYHLNKLLTRKMHKEDLKKNIYAEACYSALKNEYKALINFKVKEGVDKKISCFEAICEKELEYSDIIDLESVYQFSMKVEVSLTPDVAYDIYRYVYNSEIAYAKDMVNDLICKPIYDDFYVKNTKELQEVLTEVGGVPLRKYGELDKWCEDRGVGYSFLSREMKLFKTAIEGKEIPCSDFCGGFIQLLNRFNGQVALYYNIEELGTDYFKFK